MALSGPLSVLGVEIPRAMTFFAYLYVIVASVIAFRIGRPLIGLNFLRERLNAAYRYALVRLRDNSENIAFHRGERVEGATLGTRFGAVIDNAWALVYRNLRFLGFNFVISQASTLVPYVIQAPRFFARAITLGDVQQTGVAFGQVHDSLSFFRNSYDDFAVYRAVLIRLTGLLDADAEARALPSVTLEQADGLEVRDLTVRLPDDQVLVDDLDLDLTAGDALLVAGASGSGKTTLLRSLADLWPWADGTVRRPLGDDALFLSQQPYVPLGSLRTALAYPRPGRRASTTTGRRPCCGRCSSPSSSTGSTRRSTGPAGCPPASSSASASPACCSPARAWCSSTRRPRRWTRAWSTPSTRCCATSCPRP